ncbi:hypothetical protein [Paenibacillus eucommiae]|uniref:Pectate lyase superfamily protein domain-containing protein n=1 Tax=Paenibacillus eucommiae TaxID=1355755 RepID=A0ABS4J3W1_9BACL|nr:hypothetical protein [Paenibacillus eucommiae]MBP1994524.1 hypothetical protein [Paenibacillus eucommiae]
MSEDKKMEDLQSPEQEKSLISRRKLLASLGMAGVALASTGLVNGAISKAYADPIESRTKVKDLMLGSSVTGPSTTTLTPNLKLKQTDPLDSIDVNGNFERIDSEFAGRSITPDFYKVGTGLDDTAAVQAAFDSGKPVIFNRDYYVKSVRMFGIDQKIDFNGFWLWGISSSSDTAAERDCVLEIAGLYLQLYNIKVIAYEFSLNYKCGVHWRSESNTRPAEHIKIYGLQINRFIVGLQYGAYLDDPSPLDAPQSENYIFGIHFRSVQNCMILNQPNGVLKIMGGVIDCSPYEWNTLSPTPYSHADAYCFYNKDTSLTIDNCAILKVASAEGYAFKGSVFTLSNCTIEIGSTWGYLEGDAYITQSDMGFQGGNYQHLFEVAPNTEGRLLLNRVFTKRTSGFGGISTAYVIHGLSAAPAYKVIIEKSKFHEWADYRIASSDRDRVHVEHTRFNFTDTDSVFYNKLVNDQESFTNLAVNVDTTGQYMAAVSDTNPKSGWMMYVYTGTGTVYFRKNTMDVPLGFQSAIEVKASSGISYIYSHPFPIPQGHAISFRGWAKYTTGGADETVKIVWVNASGVVIGSFTLITTADIKTTKWTQVVKAIAVPAAAASAYLQISADSGSILVSGMEVFAQQEILHRESFINQLNNALGTAGEGYIMKSPNGTSYKVTITDAGVLNCQVYP